MISSFILLTFLCYVVYRVYRSFRPEKTIDPNGKYVLITGCDTGFGNLLAIELDRQGFNVLAGVLNSASISELTGRLSRRATVFQLDITNSDDIEAAYQLVKSKTNILHGLVNNAGIGRAGYIDWISMKLYQRTMDVNFFGQVAVTKKFLPLLIAKADSRIVNICSIMGFISPPSMSAYCASKYAFEAFSDCLRREMKVWKLHVSIVEPGWLRTPIIQGHENHLRDLWKEVPSDVRERWGDQFFDEVVNTYAVNSPFIRYAEDPMKVVRALQHAIISSEPQIRYRPDFQGSFIFFPLSLLPAWLADSIMCTLLALKNKPAGVHFQTESNRIGQ